MSISGIAGPSGEQKGKPIGTMAFALCSEIANKNSLIYLKETDRQNIQHHAAFFALDFLISAFK